MFPMVTELVITLKNKRKQPDEATKMHFTDLVVAVYHEMQC